MYRTILPKDIDSKFRFITVAAQRAKQLQGGAKPRVETRSRKPTRIAVEEAIAGTISWEVREDVAPAAQEANGSGE
jgi:DNA-directed RNA polymerase subunit omega